MLNKDPDHPIIDQPWQYSIVDFHVHADSDTGESFIDMTLRREGVQRRLRFLDPQNIVIDEGCFPQPTGGMQILDVSHRQLDGLTVEVGDFENEGGAVTFCARQVVDLDRVLDS